MLLKRLCIILLLVSQAAVICAQSRPAAAFQVKAAYLYNFTRFVEWEPDAYAAPDAPFIIGVLGNKLVGDYLQEIVRGEKVGNRPIIVQQYRSISEVRNCRILFMSAAEASRARESLPEMTGKGILTVSDGESFLKWGGMIRFFNQENKIKIQINSSAARSGQLQISSKLLSVAAAY